MKILTGGGTGFIGSALRERLKDHDVTPISRRGELTWETLKKEGLPECDAVINLAGAPIIEHAWTPEYKRELFSSRIDTTRLLATLIAKSKNPPLVFITASAIGYYPSGTAYLHGEGDSPGDNFLARLAKQWESVAELPEGCRTRHVTMRIGIVLSRDGGALKKMAPIFKKRLGGPIGNGNQGFAWIHIEDLLGLFELALLDDRVRGPINAVAPDCVKQRDFAKALGKALRKPAILPLPAFAVKLLFGQRGEALLQGPFAAPRRALELGYHFLYPTLGEALHELLSCGMI